jgi:ech hydrogenase subunit A
VIALSVLFTVFFWQGGEASVLNTKAFSYLLTLMEASVALFIIISGLRAKRFLAAGLAAAQIIILLLYELSAIEVMPEPTFVIDRLALLMALVVGVIGGLIYLFAIKYMRDYHAHNDDVKDRSGLFFSALFIFTGAMFGLVLSNDMRLMLFFWEITTLASFILIGYSKSPKAVDSAFLALTINVFGGLLFTIGIALAGLKFNIGGFQGLLSIRGGGSAIAAAVFLFACAGLTKAAQMPFSKWLLGAMVAPTPVSAMLHSSAMVKAGVYLIIRLSPLMGLNAAGITITFIGGITFLAAAMLAISQIDAKRILAYSTISNLGLIVACAGINTAWSIWAAIMLIIFHAAAKSLLFLTVGRAEHSIGSKSVERMDGLIKTSPELAMLLVIGIAGMFIAPFGMLISKWAAMKAFLDYGGALVNTALLLIIAVGSAVTFFYWTKWLGKLIAETTLFKPDGNIHTLSMEEKISLYSGGAAVILLCILFPLISKLFAIPYTAPIYEAAAPAIAGTDAILTALMLALLFALIFISRLLCRKFKWQTATAYMMGQNTGDNRSYYGSIGQTLTVTLSNWYLNDIFGEKIWLNKTLIFSSALLFLGFLAIIGGVGL